MKKLRLITLIIGMAWMLHGYADDFVDAGHPAGVCTDRGSAETYLAGLPLSPLEGIWEYPAEETALLVLADPRSKGSYGIFFLEGIDCRLTPGMRLGGLQATPNTSKFKISLCSKLQKGLPGNFQEGSATLNDREDALVIEMPKLKVNLNPSTVLPALWNRLRINLRIRTTSPADRLPEGWIKAYPADSPTLPIYL